MRTLKLLKSGIIAGVLAVAMSGCIKSEDPEFSVNVNSAFVEQYGSGSSAQFAPYILIYSQTHMIKSAEVSFKSMPYSFKSIGVYGNAMEISASGGIYGGFPLDYSLPNGDYKITAKDFEATSIATNGFTISCSDDQRIGELNVTKFGYTASEGIKAEWVAAENATHYGLVIMPMTEVEGTTVSFGKSLILWNGNGDKTKTSGTYNPRDFYTPGQKMRVGIAALAGNSDELQLPNVVVLVGKTFDIVWGTDYSDTVTE